LPIYAYNPAAFFSDLLQQVTKRVWFIAAYIYGVLSSHSDGIPLCASKSNAFGRSAMPVILLRRVPHFFLVGLLSHPLVGLLPHVLEIIGFRNV
jgi:hypothetical protein